MESEVWQQLIEDIGAKIDWKFALKDKDRRIFRPRNGYYEEISKEEAKIEVRRHLTTARPATIAGLVDAFLEGEERLLDESLFLDSRERGVGFLNGVFDLRTGELRAYAPHDFILDPLPHMLPRTCEKSLERWFVEDILASWVTPDVADWFCNLLAYILFVHPNHEQKWINLFGMGANGKSVCLKILEKGLGRKKVIGCDLQHINRFSKETFQGKWLVLGRDSGNYVNDAATSLIKNYSGDDTTVNEIKGGGSYDATITGKLIVSTNNLIQSRDRTHGWFRRIFPVPFPNSFPVNPAFETDLLKKLPQILRVLCHRAYLYTMSENTLEGCLPRAVRDLIQETRFLNDRTAGFWELHFHHYEERQEMDEHGRPTPIIVTKLRDDDKIREIHGLKMAEVYNVFKAWHADEFGDMPVEPSLTAFGGPYGAFLQSEAGRYFTYHKTKFGRLVELKPEYLAEFFRSPAVTVTTPEPEIVQDDWTKT